MIQYSGIQYTIEKAQIDYNNAFDQLQTICQKYIHNRHKVMNCSQKTLPLIKNAHRISYEDIQEKIYANIPGFKTLLTVIHQNYPEKVLSVLIYLIKYYNHDYSKKSVLYLAQNFRKSFIDAVDFLCMKKPSQENYNDEVIFQTNWNKYYHLLQNIIDIYNQEDFLSLQAGKLA